MTSQAIVLMQLHRQKKRNKVIFFNFVITVGNRLPLMIIKMIMLSIENENHVVRNTISRYVQYLLLNKFLFNSKVFLKIYLIGGKHFVNPEKYSGF